MVLPMKATLRTRAVITATGPLAHSCPGCGQPRGPLEVVCPNCLPSVPRSIRQELQRLVDAGVAWTVHPAWLDVYQAATRAARLVIPKASRPWGAR